MIEIIPSILSADFARLAEAIELVESAGVGMLHIDVMDGHFVPNITIGPPVVQSIRKTTRLTLDVHLMITDPDSYIGPFVEAGADQLSVHQEVCPHLDRTVRQIQAEGARAGVVINPATPVTMLEDIFGVADYILVMSVNPGFGGQSFIPRSLEKVRRLDQWRRERNRQIPLEIDGGIDARTIGDAVKAGCNWFVAGSAIFGSPDPVQAIGQLQQCAREALTVHV